MISLIQFLISRTPSKIFKMASNSFDLCPGTKVATCDVKFENRFGSTDTFKMAVDQRKMACAIFPKCRNSGNNSWNCTILGAEEDLGCIFNVAYFDLGETSRDLSMT